MKTKMSYEDRHKQIKTDYYDLLETLGSKILLIGGHEDDFDTAYEKMRQLIEDFVLERINDK